MRQNGACAFQQPQHAVGSTVHCILGQTHTNSDAPCSALLFRRSNQSSLTSKRFSGSPNIDWNYLPRRDFQLLLGLSWQKDAASAFRKGRTCVRCQENGVPWWQELLGDLGLRRRGKEASTRWGQGSDRREGRRRDERPEVPSRGVSTLDELAGRPRPPDSTTRGTRITSRGTTGTASGGAGTTSRGTGRWRPLGGASRFRPPLDGNGYSEDSWWDGFSGDKKEEDRNVWGGGKAGPWWERSRKRGGGLRGWFDRWRKSDNGAYYDRPPPREAGRPDSNRRRDDDRDPLDAELMTPGERELNDQLESLIKYKPTVAKWNDWVDDSYSSKYSDYVGGSGNGWYDEENEWLKGGNPRLPPDIPERGMSRTIKEMVLRIFEPPYEVEDDLGFEERVFRFTTQETAKFVVALLFCVVVSDWVVHDFVLVPFMKRYTEEVPLVAKAFDLRKSQKLNIVQRLKLERQRVRFEAEIGKAPPLSEKEMREHMREEALHLREEVRAENRASFSNIISDFVAFAVGALVFFLNPKRVALMQLTGQRIFTNISDTGKAFIIILLTDIFLGYHSETGWETIVELFLDHYGLEVEQHSIYIFVSTVPVTIDAVFKLWVFRFLSKLSPSAAATFKTMNRH